MVELDRTADETDVAKSSQPVPYIFLFRLQ